MKRRGPGRPKLAKGESKATIFSVRFAPVERKRIEDAAKIKNAKAGAWAREILLKAAASILEA